MDNLFQKTRQFFKRIRNADLKESEAFLVEEGTSVQDLQFLKAAPRRISIVKPFDDERGFKEYIKDFNNPDSCVFIKKTSIEVNFDYHGKTKPSWNEHKSTFPLVTSSYINPWLKIEGQELTQQDFVKFLQLNYLIVTNPTHADLISATKNLRVTSSINSYSSIETGGTSIDYKENSFVVSVKDSKGGGTKDVTVPDSITIQCPYFEGLGQVSKFQLKVFASVRDNRPVFKIHFLDKDQVLFGLYKDIQDSYKKTFDKLKIYIG